MSNFPTGSISHGTMRPEDLIPTFADTVLRLIREHKEQILAHTLGVSIVNLEAMTEIAKDVQKRYEAPGYYDTDVVQDDMEGLMGILDVLAPPDHYFGTHPGDGSDYGFWRLESEDEDTAQALINAIHAHGKRFVTWCIATERFRSMETVADVEEATEAYLANA